MLVRAVEQGAAYPSMAPNTRADVSHSTIPSLWARDRAGMPVAEGLIHHNDAGSQYTSFAFSQRLLDAGVDACVGSVGDGYGNALAETTVGLCKSLFQKALDLAGRRAIVRV